MDWWYAADLMGIVVFLPALVISLVRVIRPLSLIDSHLADIVEQCNDIAASLDGLPGLSETELLTGAGGPGIDRYAEAMGNAR